MNRDEIELKLYNDIRDALDAKDVAKIKEIAPALTEETIEKLIDEYHNVNVETDTTRRRFHIGFEIFESAYNRGSIHNR